MSKEVTETPKDDSVVVMRGKQGVAGVPFAKGTLLLVLALVVVTAGLLLSGYMAVVWKRPSQSVSLGSVRVCGDDVVTTYNNASLYEKRDNSGSDTLDQKAIDGLVATIGAKSGHEKDPTCEMILLMAAIQKNDYKTAKEAYGVVKALHDKHAYADSNLRTGGPLSAYEMFVEQLAPSSQSGDQKAQGGA